MKKIFAGLFLLLSLSLQAIDYEIGSGSTLNPVHTAIPLLSIAPDSRAGGMGDVGAATTPDISSQYWNPAKFPFMKSEAGVGLSYTPWLSKLNADINLGYLSGYWRFSEGQALSASLRYFSLGEVIFRQSGEDREGVSVHPNEFAIDLAYSRLLSEKWSAAVALRYIRSDLNVGMGSVGSASDMYPANAVAADIAAYYTTPLTVSGQDANLAFGIDVSNIGSKVTYDKGSTSNFLPANLRLGTSFDYPFDDFNKISVSLDLNKFLVPTYPFEPVLREGEDRDDQSYIDRYNKYKDAEKEYKDMSSIAGIFKSFGDAPRGFEEELEEIMWSVGLEYSYMNQFFARAGYFNEAANKGNRKYFTAGAGFKLNVFQLDAAYVIAASPSNPLDKTLRFSLAFDLEGLKGLTK